LKGYMIGQEGKGRSKSVKTYFDKKLEMNIDFEGGREDRSDLAFLVTKSATKPSPDCAS